MTYTKITSKYPNILKPDMSNPSMRPTELPNQPAQINPGIARPKARMGNDPMKDAKDFHSKKLGAGGPGYAAPIGNSRSIIKKLSKTYTKHPGRKYPSA